MSSHAYDIALSFSGEDRSYVEMVADQLRARQVTVVYDRYEQADLWGKDLYTHLIDVYRQKAQYTLMFISVHYRDKVWTNHERRAAQARALEEAREYILPARFDDTEIPGVLPTTAFIDLRTRSPAEVAVLVCDKLGRNLLKQKAHVLPSPRSPAVCGDARFDYSSYNGRYRIGDGSFEFETSWARASNMSIYCTTDTPSLRGIALAPLGTDVRHVMNATALDYTSRVRCPQINQVVVLQNTNGFYAALRVESIRDSTREDAADELHFRYWILTDGSANFSVVEEP